ncbi:hypothetical protein [Cesiribacter sp. SM1]|uniref:hypothetical protein n=1 Tax=Cesiribacter sp. SM1 TaxID=2861196 RepID=UPI001CD46F49|nr:hypothetical protein [Cesiribacter sp. SM1]
MFFRIATAASNQLSALIKAIAREHLQTYRSNGALSPSKVCITGIRDFNPAVYGFVQTTTAVTTDGAYGKGWLCFFNVTLP